MVESRHSSLLLCLLGIAVLAWATAGCGGVDAEGANSDETGVLSAKETKRLLHQLPYRYTFRSVATPKGAEAAVAGRAIGAHHTVFNFGIALGHGHYGVPVPRAGTIDSYGFPKGGFIFTGDSLIKDPGGRVIANPKFKTAAQWREAGHMEDMMTDKLCLAATGEHCPP